MSEQPLDNYVAYQEQPARIQMQSARIHEKQPAMYQECLAIYKEQPVIYKEQPVMYQEQPARYEEPAWRKEQVAMRPINNSNPKQAPKLFHPLAYAWPKTEADIDSPATQIRSYMTSSPKKNDPASVVGGEMPHGEHPKAAKVSRFAASFAEKCSTSSSVPMEVVSSSLNSVRSLFCASETEETFMGDTSKADEIWSSSEGTSGYLTQAVSSQESHEQSSFGHSFGQPGNHEPTNGHQFASSQDSQDLSIFDRSLSPPKDSSKSNKAKSRNPKAPAFDPTKVQVINFNKQPFVELEAYKVYQAKHAQQNVKASASSDANWRAEPKPVNLVNDLDQLINTLLILKLAAVEAGVVGLDPENMDARLLNLLKLLNYGQTLSRALGEEPPSNSALNRLASQINVSSRPIGPDVLNNAKFAANLDNLLVNEDPVWSPPRAGKQNADRNDNRGGQSNGQPNGQLNGNRAGQRNGNWNGQQNNQGQTNWNGNMNGHPNGHPNGNQNGNQNGNPNGHPNGHPNDNQNNNRRGGRQAARMECAFCRNNGEPVEVYRGHILKDENEIVRCPVLRAYDCPICRSGGGDHAHTVRYCPMNRFQAIGDQLGHARPEMTV